MKNTSVCLILPFFDEKKKMSWIRQKKFPEYFKYFVGSFSRNQFVSLKIFTNVPCEKIPKEYSNPI